MSFKCARPGDLLENSDGIWRRCFLFEATRDTQTGLVDDLVMVGRVEG